MAALTLLGTAVTVGALLMATPVREARHEVEDNRATLVLREPTHVSLTMYIAFDEALHRALAPQSPMSQFVLTYAAMTTPQFQRELQRAQQRFQSATRVNGADGKPLALRDWRWPDASAVQSALKQRAMELVVAPDEHPHGAPLEIRAEATAARPIRSVNVRFPAEFQRVLVVAYAPRQVWADPTKAAPTIAFP